MTIVCGTDLSERSRPGIVAAAAIAAAMRTPLWIAHVVGESLSLLEPEVRDQLGTAVRERLDRETAPAPGGVAVHHAMLEGSPHDALLSLARTESASLLVVSSKGHGGAPLYRIGGTSERLALDAPVPLLVVRDAAPFQGWAKGERALRIVVGVDFTASAAAAIRWTKALAGAGPCEVVFAHLYYESEAQARYGLTDEAGAGAGAEARALLERDVAAFVGAFPQLGSHAVRVLPSLGRTSDPLLALAREERADLVVVGTHHRRGPGRLASVSTAVLHRAPMAVAVVPTPAAGLEAAMVDRIRRVLVATDLTPASNAVIPFAFALLDRGGTVHLLHVLPMRERSEERDRYDATVLEQLRGLVPPGVAERGVSAEVEVAHAVVVGAICDAAERLGVDLICVSGRHHGLARVMGSVVPELLRESHKPVLVYRGPPA